VPDSWMTVSWFDSLQTYHHNLLVSGNSYRNHDLGTYRHEQARLERV